ncbi:thioredoxin [Lusitaniella coriacea LEGE 07157]|uniref:Thioredoxin n=1 Tax=Lusitaniella coriacea LEGE 07157 TaxID=945747 RepID=A0A8J7DY03_9CYAN|nr:thioredoxin family protein [Lusitaniella coriacea]MBE9116493.1 thioredoxin [Lusitaniella coriacea LEGE 07157]
MSSVVAITDENFETEVFTSPKTVLVYFWASWCGPCKLVSPSIDWAAQTYSDRLKVVKLEVDPNPDAVAKCKVEGVPALRLFKEKEIVASHEGAIGKQALQAMLESNLTS